MVPYWEQFEQVHFIVSIDGVGDVADYVRHPSDWEEIEANIRRFDGWARTRSRTSTSRRTL